MTFFKSVFLSFTIWIVATLVNALLGGTWLTYFSEQPDYSPGAYLLLFICTLVFSIPAMFIFWVVLLSNWDSDNLFKILLRTGIVVAALSTLVLFFFPAGVIHSDMLFLAPCIVIATIFSIMVHHSIIKSIASNKITDHV